MTQVSIIFDSPDKARAFMLWLEEVGEQDYYGWIRIVAPQDEVETFEYDHNHRIIKTMN